MSKLTLIIFCSFILSGMSSPPLHVGGLAPSFELENMKGEIVKSSDFKNKTIIINFWATWCVPCIKEIPAFNKVYPSLKNNNTEIIAINFAENRSEVDEFIREYPVNFPVLLDKYGDVAQDYRVRTLPVTYVISPDGIIVDMIFGSITLQLIEGKFGKY